jgi:hypothetical protein
MKFEFDSAKSKLNKLKHGVDFIEAQEIWSGPFCEIPAKDKAEQRRLVIGHVGAKLYSAIVTRRGAMIRIISARRARDEEKKIHGRLTNDG